MLERFWFWLAWRTPTRLVYWCVVRAFAHATTGLYGNTHPDALNYSAVMDRFADPYGGDPRWKRRGKALSELHGG